MSAPRKPVICKRTSGTELKEGEIYYRYRGQSRVIGFNELKQIHLEIRGRERLLWMEHVRRIAKVGPQNIALVDLMEGSIAASKGRRELLIDPSLLKKLRQEVSFIKEGEFSETKGKPVLKLVGDIKAANNIVVPKMDPNKDYPFLSSHLAQELQIRPYDAQVLIWKLDLKKSMKFCLEVQTSKQGQIFKYSKQALTEMKNYLAAQKDTQSSLKKLSVEYQAHCQRRQETGKKTV